MMSCAGEGNCAQSAASPMGPAPTVTTVDQLDLAVRHAAFRSVGGMSLSMTSAPSSVPAGI